MKLDTYYLEREVKRDKIISNLKEENKRQAQELEVTRKLLSDEIYCFDYCKNFMEKESKLTRYCARGSDCKFEWNGRKLEVSDERS